MKLHAHFNVRFFKKSGRSDIDLALAGAGVNQALLGRIAQDLDDLLLPWRFDLSLLPRITHADLLDHIRRVGLTLYEKNPHDASN